MLVYSLKRLGRALITLVILITIVFILVRAMPEEGYFSNYEKMSPQQIEVGLRKMGLKDPLYVQVGKFIYNALHGDLGTSYRYRINAKITDIISSKIGISMKVGLISMVVSLPLGMALGILMARSKGGFADKLGNAYIVFIQAVPNAVYFIFIQLYGSDLFRVSMLYKETEWTSLILPVISLALPSISSYAMWLRRYMVDETNKDYIKLARAKGVPNSTIWFRHVFRNSVVPMVNLIPGSILLTISGSIYVESLYSIPGMGGLLVDVIKRQDNNMVLALVVIFAVMSILGLLLGDLLMFYSAKEQKLITLDEYIEKMPEGQKAIYFAAGDEAARLGKLPNAQLVLSKGYDLLLCSEDVDEFCLQIMHDYKEKEFKNINSGDLGLETEDEKKAAEETATENKDLFEEIKKALNGKIKDVKVNPTLQDHPVSLSSEGGISMEMEKILRKMPAGGEGMESTKVLELNPNHAVFGALKAAHEAGDTDKLKKYSALLYAQAQLIEGLPVDDPAAYAEAVCSLMK